MPKEHEGKAQFNIFIEQEFIDILEAYALYMIRKGKISEKGKAGHKTEAFRSAMAFIHLSFPLSDILTEIEQKRKAMAKETAGEIEA